MKENEISFTFIVPHRETESIEKTIAAIKNIFVELEMDYEILSVYGNNPTIQRNECIKSAKSEYIYFLDSDSILTKESFNELKVYLEKNPETAIIGGPSLTPPSDSYLQKNFDAILGSFLAVGRISSRYSRHGKIRETDDSELILCNLAVKKSIFEKYGKFNENLYPNEENEFIYRIKSSGEKVIYNPDIYVFRSQRKSLKDFIKQMFTYGRGRGEQTRVSPKSFRPGILVPILFSLYVVFLLVSDIVFPSNIVMYYFIPLFLYLIFMGISLIHKSIKDVMIYLYYPILFFLTHTIYCLGFFPGYFNKSFKADKTKFYCKIEKI